jgi:aminoglycoside phosphotransferase (APT) family kinase protein
MLCRISTIRRYKAIADGGGQGGAVANFQDHPTTVRPGEELDVEKLEPFLRSHFPGHSGPVRVEQYPSGHSNLTYSIGLGEKQLVLRRPPFGSNVKSAHDMGREFRVLSKLHAAYSPAPEVLLFCDDASILGAPFYIMNPVCGLILRRDPPAGLEFSPTIARRLSESFVDNLAHLHGLDYQAVGLAELGKPEGYLERQVRGWTERYAGSQTHDYPEVRAIALWMTQHMPPAQDAVLIHNDYKYDNAVLDSNDIAQIIGLLDWEMSTIGDPLTDLGTALAYWVNADDPQELQAIRWGPTNVAGSFTREQIAGRYAQKTGRDVSNIAFYLTFARFKLAVIVQQIYFRFHQGLTKDQRFASMPGLIQTLLRTSLDCAQTGKI